MLSAVEIDPGYVVDGANLGIIDIEPGYGVNGLGQYDYDNVQLVGCDALGNCGPGLGQYDYDTVQLVGGLGISDTTKKILLYGGIGLGVIGAAIGGYMLFR